MVAKRLRSRFCFLLIILIRAILISICLLKIGRFLSLGENSRNRCLRACTAWF